MLAPDANFCKSFQVYGILVSVRSTQSLDWLEADFAYFLPAKSDHNATISLDLEPLGLARPPALAATHVKSDCVIFKNGGETWIDYQGQAWLWRQDHARATLYVNEPNLAQELTYLFLQSVLGELLEARGLFRVHALSFTFRSKACLFLSPSGGGKSSLALRLLNRPEVQLWGDDICLADARGNLWPYPMRFSFSPDTKLPPALQSQTQLWTRRKFGPKKLLPNPSANLLATPVSFIILGERWTKRESAEVQLVSRFAFCLPLLRELVVGIGLPQVAELILSQGVLKNLSLGWVALKRLLVACALLQRSCCLKIKLSRESKDNVEELLSALRNLTINP